MTNGNTEIIFSEKYDYEAGKSHQWDAFAQPSGFGFNWSSNYTVYLKHLKFLILLMEQVVN